MHQCVGVFTGTLPRSVMVKFVTNKARDVVLRKSELFRYSNFHHIWIVPDTTCPQKHQVAHTAKPNQQCSLILESLLINLTPIPWSQGKRVQNSIMINPPYLEALDRKQTLHLLFMVLILYSPFWDQKKRMKTSQINSSGTRSREARHIKILCTYSSSLHNKIHELQYHASTALPDANKRSWVICRWEQALQKG